MAIKHVGFQGAERHVEAEGYSPAEAGRIIGYGKAHASAAAKRANPHLRNTAGHMTHGKPTIKAVSFKKGR